MKRFVMDDDAKAEVAEALSYLEEQREGLAALFREELNKAFKRIRKTPRAFPFFANTDFRKCILRQFSYTIYFLELDDRIWVASVAHQKRKPGYWMDRTPE